MLLSPVIIQKGRVITRFNKIKSLRLLPGAILIALGGGICLGAERSCFAGIGVVGAGAFACARALSVLAAAGAVRARAGARGGWNGPLLFLCLKGGHVGTLHCGWIKRTRTARASRVLFLCSVWTTAWIWHVCYLLVVFVFGCKLRLFPFGLGSPPNLVHRGFHLLSYFFAASIIFLKTSGLSFASSARTFLSSSMFCCFKPYINFE